MAPPADVDLPGGRWRATLPRLRSMDRRCRGLPFVRYDTAGLQQVFGDVFRREAQAADAHVTPSGKVQSFAYYHFARAS